MGEIYDRIKNISKHKVGGFSMKYIQPITKYLGTLTLFTLISFPSFAYSTKVLDIVVAPGADPSGSTIIFDTGNGPPTTPLIPAGTRFLAKGRIYPGNTFNTAGPFASPTGLLYPNKIIGGWWCNGLLTSDTTIFTPGSSNEPIGYSTFDLHFNSANTAAKDYSIYVNDTLGTIDVALAGSGQPATSRSGVATVGQKSLITMVSIIEYVDTSGNILVRIVFSDAIETGTGQAPN